DAAGTESALYPDAAAVVLHDLFADGQPEASAARLVGESVAHLLELLEDLLVIGRSDPDAGVGDTDGNLPALRLRGDGDRARLRNLHGIRDQIDHHLDQPVAIARHRRQSELDILHESHRLAFE